MSKSHIFRLYSSKRRGPGRSPGPRSVACLRKTRVECTLDEGGSHQVCLENLVFNWGVILVLYPSNSIKSCQYNDLHLSISLLVLYPSNSIKFCQYNDLHLSSLLVVFHPSNSIRFCQYNDFHLSQIWFGKLAFNCGVILFIYPSNIIKFCQYNYLHLSLLLAAVYRLRGKP